MMKRFRRVQNFDGDERKPSFGKTKFGKEYTKNLEEVFASAFQVSTCVERSSGRNQLVQTLNLMELTSYTRRQLWTLLLGTVAINLLSTILYDVEQSMLLQSFRSKFLHQLEGFCP